MNGSTNDPFHEIGGVSVRPDDEIARLRAELSILQAENETLRGDVAVLGRALRGDSRYADAIKDEMLKSAEAALEQATKERDEANVLRAEAQNDAFRLADRLVRCEAALAQVREGAEACASRLEAELNTPDDIWADHIREALRLLTESTRLIGVPIQGNKAQ